MIRLSVPAQLVIIFAILGSKNLGFAQPAQEMSVVLRGLDKITARVTTFNLPLGRIVKFGTLKIIARTCHKRPPEDPPEISAFLEIDEEISGKGNFRPLFTGWMFASSPALSALEHSVYDVWVIDCSTAVGVGDLHKE